MTFKEAGEQKQADLSRSLTIVELIIRGVERFCKVRKREECKRESEDRTLHL